MDYKMVHNIVDVLENMGFVVFDKNDEDFDIRDYIIDSIQFMQFIVSLEEEIGIELPDDFLLYEILSSAQGLSNAIVSHMNEIAILNPDNTEATTKR